MHRILLTGSNGLLGQKIVHLLRQKNDIELLATSTGHNRISTTEGYDYRELDITVKASVNQIVQEFQPTAIINTAAMTNVDACENEKEKCRSLNVDAVSHLLEASQAIGAKLIHLSTDFVFNGESGPYKEEDRPDPLSYYAQSKYDSEQLLLNSSYKNWAIARTIIVYGYTENMSRNNIILWARKALRDGDQMTIVDDQFRSPTLAEDLAIGCWLIAEKDKTGIFHLGGPKTYSIIELVRAVANFYGFDHDNVVPISSITLNQAAKRPPRTGLVIDKARNLLGYDPRSLEEGLAIIDSLDPL